MNTFVLDRNSRQKLKLRVLGQVDSVEVISNQSAELPIASAGRWPAASGEDGHTDTVADL